MEVKVRILKVKGKKTSFKTQMELDGGAAGSDGVGTLRRPAWGAISAISNL